MEKSCLTCIHKDPCIARSTTVFALFIQTGRYGEVKDAQANLDVGSNCKNWEGAER